MCWRLNGHLIRRCDGGRQSRRDRHSTVSKRHQVRRAKRVSLLLTSLSHTFVRRVTLIVSYASFYSPGFLQMAVLCPQARNLGNMYQFKQDLRVETERKSERRLLKAFYDKNCHEYPYLYAYEEEYNDTVVDMILMDKRETKLMMVQAATLVLSGKIKICNDKRKNDTH